MPRVWISLGSNVDRERTIRSAVRKLRCRYAEVLLSPVYESAAVGFEGEPFYNLVVGLDTEQPARDLCHELQDLETALGRVRGLEKFAPRTLDADLLLYGDRVFSEGSCRVPREEILHYAFVLRPLTDVAGELQHPVLGRPLRMLWEEFPQAEQPLRQVRLDLD